MRKVKIFSVFLSIILLFNCTAATLTASAIFTPSFELFSEGVYMVNLDTDIPIVSKNADKKMYPASTTKIMTALLSFELIKNFNDTVEVPYDCFNEFTWNSSSEYYNPNTCGASNADIQPGQSNLTYWDCLYALMVCSACEAANILAYNLGGKSIKAFVDGMNNLAAKLGCKNTHFSNPHGLYDDDNYTTPYDLYLITKYAIEKYPRLLEISNTYSYDMPPNSNNPDGYTIYHTNQMIKPDSEYYYEGVCGVKTGSIDYYYHRNSDGTINETDYDYGSRALVSTAKKNGYNYIIVSMGAPYWNDDKTALTEKNLSFVDHTKLYDWAFGEFEYTLVIGKNEQIMQVDVEKGEDADTVALVATEDFWTLLPKSLDKSTIQRVRPEIDHLEAPVTKGDETGNLVLRLNGETLANIKLVTENDVELSMTAYYKEKLDELMATPQFPAIIICAVLLIVVYITAMVMRRNHKLKVQEQQRRRKINSISNGGQKPRNNQQKRR